MTKSTSWTLEQVVALLERVPLFQGLPHADLEGIARLVQGRSVEAGELLFREGDAGDKFYIVFSGAIEILKERPRGENERLAVKRGGDSFGDEVAVDVGATSGVLPGASGGGGSGWHSTSWRTNTPRKMGEV